MSKETVIDRVVEYLIKEMNVPENMIEKNIPLSEYEDGIVGTMDITVVAEDGDDCLVPLMVIQCLDEDVNLDEAEVEKHMDFLELIDSTTNVGRLIITNGDQMMYADWNGTELEEEDALPSYDKMVKELKDTEREYMEYVATNGEEEEHHH